MTAQPARNDRLLSGFVIAAAGTLLITVIAITGAPSLLVLDRVLREGPLLLWWCVAAGGYGHWLTIWLAPKRAPRLLLKITGIGVGFGVISLLTLGLGTLSWLNASSAYGLLIVGTVLFPWYELKSIDWRWRPTLTPVAFVWLPVFVLGGIMLVADCVPPGLLWTDEPHGYDVVEYHLQVPREWYEAGRIQPLEHNVFSYLPMNVEMHYLLAMQLRGGPWAGMYLAQMMNSIFIGVMIVTLLIAVGWPAAIISAAVPWLTMLGSICYVEAGQLMWATLAIVWMLRSETIRAAMIGGVCAGFACGAKLTAVPMLVVTLPAAMLLARLVHLLSRKSAKGKAISRDAPSPMLLAQRCGIFIAIALLVFSPWLVRTFVATGNPVFPQAMKLLGRGPFNEVQQIRWERSQEPAMMQRSIVGRLGALGEQLLLDIRWGWIFWPIGIAAVVARIRSNSVLLIAVFGQLLFWIFFTHLQGRFALLMLPMSAVAIGEIHSVVWRRCLGGAAVIMCFVGMFPLLQRLLPLTQVIGVDDFKSLLPQEAADAVDAGQPLALIGDAKAFWYQVPISRLRYRTVFDVKARSDQSAVAHWLDPTDAAGAVRVTNADELQRLSRSYYGLPQP